MNRRTITDIKKDKELLLQQTYELGKRIRKLDEEIDVIRRNRQLGCKHRHTRQRGNSYFEEGRMAAPHYWEEKVCTRCGKVVAQTRTKEVWIHFTD